MKVGQKHLIRCKCVLPQFRKMADPPLHMFTVFSVIDQDTDSVDIKFVQCSNCGAVHKVIDIGRSEIIQNKEDLRSCVSIEDIKSSLPDSLSGILETHECDLPTWEFAKFIIENQRWGDFIVLSSETMDGMRQGKYLRILGERLYKVDQFVRGELVG